MGMIPSVTVEELIEKMRNRAEIPSVEVFRNDEYIGTFIVPNMRGGATIFNEIKTQAEFLGVRGNIVVPLNVQESLHEPSTPQYPNLVKAREARRLKQKVKVKV